MLNPTDLSAYENKTEEDPPLAYRPSAAEEADREEAAAPARVAPAGRPGAYGGMTSEMKRAMLAAAKEYDVDPAALLGIATKESAFREDVITGKRKSSAGAIGLMQFMPETAKEYGINPLDPVESIFGAAAYMRKSLDKFGGDYRKAIASYNAGAGGVGKRVSKHGDKWEDALPAETKGYLDFVGQFVGMDLSSPEGQVPLPKGVEPSTAGAGRGSLGERPGERAAYQAKLAQENPGLSIGQLGRDVMGGVENVKAIASAVPAFASGLNWKAQADLLSDMDAVEAGGKPAARLRPGGRLAPAVPSELARLYANAAPEDRAKMRAEAVQSMASSEESIGKAKIELDKYKAEAQRLTGKIPDFTDIESVKGFNTWLLRNAANGAPSMAASMVGALFGPAGLAVTSFGTAIGDMTQARLGALKDPTKNFGTADRIAEAAGLQPREAAQKLADNAGSTLGLSPLYAAGDMLLGPAAQLAKRAGKEVVGKTIAEVVKSNAKRLPGQIVEEAIGEGPIQEGVNIAAEIQAGEHAPGLTGKDGLRILNSAAAGAAGAPLGAAIGTVSDAARMDRGSTKTYSDPTGPAAAAGIRPVEVPNVPASAPAGDAGTETATGASQPPGGPAGPAAGQPGANPPDVPGFQDYVNADAEADYKAGVVRTPEVVNGNAGGTGTLADPSGDGRGDNAVAGVAGDGQTPAGAAGGIRVDGGSAPGVAADQPAAGAAGGQSNAVTPVSTWTGRKGDGYTTRQAAEDGLATRMKMGTGLDWKVEQKDDGKFVLNGYAPTAVQPGGLSTAGEQVQNVNVAPTTVAPTGAVDGQVGTAAGTGVVGGTGQADLGGASAAGVGSLGNPGDATGEPAGTAALGGANVAADPEVVKQDLISTQDQLLRRGDVVKLAPADTAAHPVLAALVSAFKAPITLFKVTSGKANFDAFVSNGERVYINVDSVDAPVSLAMHEIVHTMPAAIKKVLIDKVMATVTPEAKAKFLWKYQNYSKLPEAKQNEEIVAMLAQDESKTDQFWQQLHKKLGDSDFAVLAKHILDTIDKLMEKVRGHSDRAVTNNIAAVRDALTTAYAKTLKGETDWTEDPADTKAESDDAMFAERGTKGESGGFGTRSFKDGSLEVDGDAEAIRSKLPEGLQGRATKKGLSFTSADAPRVAAALDGRNVAYSREGEVLDKLPMKNGKYLGAPPDYDTPGKITKLRKMLRSLTDEGAAGRFWYENSSKAVLQMVGGDVDEARRFVALLAIYSPQAKVDTNSTFALRAWAQYKAGHPISVKTGVMDAKAQSALTSVDEFWSGEKTGNFFFNLLTEIDPSTAGKQGATIDMWMMRAGQYDTDAPSKTQYAFMENETNRIAKELGWEPQQVQAAIWVAMKARMENSGVKKRTEATSEKKGWIHYEYPIKNGKPNKTRVVDDKQAHRDNWLKHAFAHTVTKGDTQAAKFDFSDGLRRHIGQISWEARPGRSTGVLPGVNDAAYEQQVEFQQEVQRAFLGPNGEDLLAQQLGLMVDGEDILAPGVWQGEIAAGMQKQVAMAPDKGKAGQSHVDPGQLANLNVYADIMGLLLRQEGIGWHRPFYATNKGDQNGVRVSIGQPLTPKQMDDLSTAVSDEFAKLGIEDWSYDAALISSPDGVRAILGASRIDGEKLGGAKKITNAQFRAIVKSAAETSLPGGTIEGFASDMELRTNDWKENPDGQVYRQRVRAAGRSDVLDWAGAVLAPRIQSVFEDFAARYDWGDAGSIQFSAAASPDSGAVQEPGRLRGGDVSLAVDGRQDQGARGSSLEGLPGLIEVDGRMVRFGGFKPAQDAARRYMAKAGLAYKPERSYAKIDKARAQRIAIEFEALRHDPQNPAVRAAYEAMVRETSAQYEAALEAGLKVEFIDFGKTGDPYGNPRNAIIDVVENNHLWVFSTRDGFGSSEFDPKDNPLLGETSFIISGQRALANDIFRAVHDYFGHVKEGVGFRAEGEENAFRAHAAMFSPLARRALTTETRGQNSWVNFGPKAAANQKANGADTVYADQKVGLLPQWVTDEGLEDGNADAQFSSNDVTPLGFYSELLRKIDGGPGQAMPDQWRAYIKGLTTKGVKQDEIEWSGINEWLQMQAGKVSKAAVQEYLKANGVKVTETVFGDSYDGLEHDKLVHHVMEHARTEEGDDMSNEFTRMVLSMEHTWEELLPAAVRSGVTGPVLASTKRLAEIEAEPYMEGTKYKDFTLGGGKNYRELLLTIPVNEAARKAKMIEHIKRRHAAGNIDDAQLAHYLGDPGAFFSTREDADRATGMGAFKSAHWSPSNVLAHIRFNERADGDGARVLFIEEIQSDWAQSIRKSGTYNPAKPYQVFNVQTGETVAEFAQRRDAAMDAVARGVVFDYRDEGAGDLPPPGPFVGTTDAWVALAVKRMIIHAAKNGFDKIAFTTGQQNAERYDLSKQVDSIVYAKESNGTYSIVALKGGRELGKHDNIPAASLADVVGKEVAERMQRDEGKKIPGGPERELSGDGLRVGGEGMKTYYDRIIPKVVKDVLKKVGGGPLEMVSIPLREGGNPGETDAMSGAVLGPNSRVSNTVSDQIGFRINDAMREKVDGGLVQFSSEPKRWFNPALPRGAVLEPTQDELLVERELASAEKRASDLWDAGRRSALTRIMASIAPRAKANNIGDDVLPDIAQQVFYREQQNKPDSIPEFADYRAMLPKVSALQARRMSMVVDRIGPPEFEGMRQLADYQRPITETDNFKRWFRASKAVSAGGQPLIALHGTNRDIEQFRKTTPSSKKVSSGNWTGELGSWFAAPSQTKGYDVGSAEATADVFAEMRGDTGGAVYPVFLSIQNPYETETYEDLLDQSNEAGGAVALREDLIAKGYDGIVVRDSSTDGGQYRDDWVAFHPAQIKSAIGNNGNYDPTDPRIQMSAVPGAPAFDAPEASKLDNVIYALQNKQVDLKRVVAKINEAGGSLSDRNDGYLREELYQGRVADRTNRFLDDELKPMLNEMRAAGISLAQIEEFLKARHAKEANAHYKSINLNRVDNDALSGMTDADAAVILASASPVMRRLAARVDTMINGTRDLMEVSGIETPETVNGFRGAFQFYVPLYADDTHPETRTTIGQGVSVKGSMHRQRIGSTQNRTNILAHIVEAREATITRAEKNLVSIAVYSMALQNPNEDFWTIDTPKPTVWEVNPATGQVEEKVNTRYKNDPNTLMGKINGKDVAVIFNAGNDRAARMAAALKNLDVSTNVQVVQTMGKATRWLASVNTQYNPVFAVVNFARDIQGAVINLTDTEINGAQAQVLGDVPAAMRAIYRAERNKTATNPAWAALYNEFKQRGGKTGFRESFVNIEERAKGLQKEIDALGRNGASKAAHAVLDFISDNNTAIENAVRLAAYKAALDRGMSKDRAASLAKNLTVNFNRKGAHTQWAGSLFAFFNAAIQGNTRTLQALTGKHGKKIIAGGIALGVLQGLLLAGMDDEDEEAIPEFVKRTSYIIPTTKGRYIAIPMPLGLHLLPNLGRTAIEVAIALGEGNGKKAAARTFGMLTSILDSTNPLGSSETPAQMLTPTAFDPVMQLVSNEGFAGNPIYKERGQGDTAVPGYTLGRDSTNPVYKGLAYVIHMAGSGLNPYARNTELPRWMSPQPEALRMIPETIGGGVWREGEKLVDTIYAAVKGRELDENRIPMLGRFSGNLNTDQTVQSTFYKNMNKIDEAQRELRLTSKDGGDFEDTPESDRIKLAKRVRDQVTKMRNERREIEVEGGSDEKIRDIEKSMTTTMREFNAEMAASRASKKEKQ